MIVYVAIRGSKSDVINLAREFYYTAKRHEDVADNLDVEIDVSVYDGNSLYYEPFEQWLKEHE